MISGLPKEAFKRYSKDRRRVQRTYFWEEHCAGGGGAPVPLEDLEEKVWNWTIDLNLKGTYICTRAVVKHMKEQRSGKIVNISS